MDKLIIYPHRLFNLKKDEIGSIIETTLNFTLLYLENNLPELISEIELRADKKIPEEVKRNAVSATQYFVDSLHHWFVWDLLGIEKNIDDNRWNYTRHRAPRNYLKPLNLESSLIVVPRYEGSNCEKGYGLIVSLPLFEASGEAATRIFDYTVSKSPQMKYRLSKSTDYYRLKILTILDNRTPKYYFIKVLEKYGSTNRQMVRNMNSVFSRNTKSALKILSDLPPLYK